MRFKVDENLPIEFVTLLKAEEHDAVSVVTQGMKGWSDPDIISVCQREERIIVTLDTDFSDIRTYPPTEYAGIIVLRVQRQDKRHLIEVFERTLPLLESEPIEHRLWIVEEARVRIRE